ncbi:MAG: SEC-C metal-binding domain-containing protein [Geminicoccaceae bacterium]
MGRNPSCPCGSGKKFKRCCSGNPMLHWAANSNFQLSRHN